MHLISKLRLLAVMMCILCTLQVRAQDPDPDLFRTWYLKFFQSSDLSTPYNIMQIEPPIEPFLTIEEDLSYAGQGACNSFTGTFFFPFPETMQSSDWEDTGQDCGMMVHNSFEQDYFPYLQTGGWYEIEQDGEGYTLTIETPIFGIAIFNDYPLSVQDEHLDSVSIYPNPVEGELYIRDKRNSIKSLALYNSYGQLLLKKNGTTTYLDLGGLGPGIFLLEIETDRASSVKKVVRQ
jgi:hypothetical protein